jgi:hypothetical protein
VGAGPGLALASIKLVDMVRGGQLLRMSLTLPASLDGTLAHGGDRTSPRAQRGTQAGLERARRDCLGMSHKSVDLREVIAAALGAVVPAVT